MNESETQPQEDSASRYTDRTDAAAMKERIAEAIPNGGGCTEAWEALSSLRSDEDSSRRDFLKTVSAAGASASLASMGIVRVEADKPQRVEEPEVKRTLGDEHVQSLIAALNEPRVYTERAALQKGSIGYQSIMMTILPTAVGNIVHGEWSDGTSAAQYYFRTAKKTRELPEKYRNIPRADDAILTAQSGDVVLTRLATQKELQAMFHRFEIDSPEEAIAATSSEMEGFHLKAESGGELKEAQVTSLGSSVAQTEVADRIAKAENVEMISDSSTTDAEEPTVGTAGLTNCNEDWCWRCVKSSGTCAACYGSCFTIVGPACALCIIPLCGATGWACGKCLKCT